MGQFSTGDYGQRWVNFRSVLTRSASSKNKKGSKSKKSTHLSYAAEIEKLENEQDLLIRKMKLSMTELDRELERKKELEKKLRYRS